MAEQRTDEWRQARCGKLTASRFHEAVARIQKGGWSTSRGKYCWELALERYNNTPTPGGYVSPAMRFGIENEHRARAAYEFLYAPVELVMFVDHPTIPYAGCSPDGFVGKYGLVEFKVPESSTHCRYFFDEEQIPERYLKQMHWQLACTGRQWVDYVSFDPRLKEAINLKRERVHRDPYIVKAFEDEAKMFLQEVEEKVGLLYGSEGSGRKVA